MAMNSQKIKNLFICVFVTMSVISCLQQTVPATRRPPKLSQTKAKDPNDIISNINENGSVALRSIIDPQLGSYRDRATIPKNYNGYLYLAGLNITSLRNRFVKVRFKFGRFHEPVIIEGTIGQGEGITPQTDAELIILDLKNRPFEKIRLLYNLFDYNNYWDDTTGEESKEPVSGPRDSNLFCRGLRVSDDPTFSGSHTNKLCDSVGEKCLYSYAKVKDKGFVDNSTTYPLVPKKMHVDSTGKGFHNENPQDRLTRCLPDNINVAQMNDLLNLDTPLSVLVYENSLYEHTHEETGNVVLSSRPSLKGHIQTNSYLYRGPFKAISPSSWEISEDALFSQVSQNTPPSGLFQESIGSVNNPNRGYKSFLFPRSTKLRLNAGVEHLASESPFSPRSLISRGLPSHGETDFMDGCNRRVQTYDDFSNEDISSCNVTALIEVLQEDEKGNLITIHSSRTLKLQIIRSSLEDENGRELLAGSLNRCTGGPKSCAKDECCFNGACWSKKIVNKCLDNDDSVSHGNIGERCKTDYECASLCCNPSTSSCAPHSQGENRENVLCSKSPGQTCVAQEWCRVDYLPRCFKVATGVTPRGDPMCAKRCYSVPTFGTCVNGRCESPSIIYENIDTNNCDDAIDPPRTIKALQEEEKSQETSS